MMGQFRTLAALLVLALTVAPPPFRLPAAAADTAEITTAAASPAPGTSETAIAPGTTEASATATVAPPAAPEKKSGPTRIPHSIEGRKDCLMCHKEGMKTKSGVATKMPHKLHKMACTMCHKPAGDAPAAEPPAGTGTATAAPATGTGTEAAAIARNLSQEEIRSHCLICHGHEGVIKTRLSPHPERPNCIDCHQAHHIPELEAREKVTGPPHIPHAIKGHEKCLDCHGPQPDGKPPKAKASPHPKWGTCTQCHVENGKTLHKNPGLQKEGAKCLTCHGGADTGAPKSPHPDRPDCLGCHVPHPPR